MQQNFQQNFKTRGHFKELQELYFFFLFSSISVSIDQCFHSKEFQISLSLFRDHLQTHDLIPNSIQLKPPLQSFHLNEPLEQDFQRAQGASRPVAFISECFHRPVPVPVHSKNLSPVLLLFLFQRGFFSFQTSRQVLFYPKIFKDTFPSPLPQFHCSTGSRQVSNRK